MTPEQDLLQRFAQRKRTCRVYARLELTGQGLMLGAGTILAKSGGASGRIAFTREAEASVAALLALAYDEASAPFLLAKIGRAIDIWNAGDKALAQIHLALVPLPSCAEETRQFALFFAEECLAAGAEPKTLMKARGAVPALLALCKYDPGQPRDDRGRWTSGGGTGADPAGRQDHVTIRAVDPDAFKPKPDQPKPEEPASGEPPVAATDFATILGLNPDHYTYAAGADGSQTQTLTQADGTAITSTWTEDGAGGVTQTDQIRFADGTVAAASTIDPQGTQTVALGEGAVKAGLVLGRSAEAAGPLPLPAADLASQGATAVLSEAGAVSTQIGRWALTGLADAATAEAAFYFGMTRAAGPEEEVTPIGAGGQFRILSNADAVSAPIQRRSGDGWSPTGLAVADHAIQSDGSAEAAQQFRALTAAVAAIPDLGPQPVRADTPIPEVFRNQSPARLQELNADAAVPAGLLGRESDGTAGLLALSVRGASGVAGDVRPVIGRLTQEEVDEACPAYPAVQSVTSLANAKIRAAYPQATPQEIGNRVHAAVADAFFGKPGFKVNAGFQGGTALPDGLRVAGSSFLDVLHDVGNGTICIYDVKTGVSGLGVRQIHQYWNEAKQAFQNSAQRIYILEVRP